MGNFSYSLSLSLLHSLWQSALLVCLYHAICLFRQRINPIYKRNLLFILLAAQFILFLSTFFTYYTRVSILDDGYLPTGLSLMPFNQEATSFFAPWVTGIYSAVLLLKTLRLLLNWNQFCLIGKSSRIKPPIDLRLFTSLKAAEFGIRRKVNLWYSNHISTPLTFGFFKPVILLPVALVNNLTITETETLIIHEITHIRNHDYLFNWLLIVCETIFFFNPFVKMITSRIRLEREKNCDSSVLQFNYPAIRYAETLLKTARFRSAPGKFHLAAASRNIQLIKRIQFFTEEKNLRFHKKNFVPLAVLPLLALIFLNIFIIGFVNNKKIITATLPINSITVIPVNHHEITVTSIPIAAATVKTGTIPARKNNIIASVEKNAGSHIRQKHSSQEGNAILPDEFTRENMTVPVSFEEPVGSKEITLTDENSATGKSISKVYRMYFENGEWKFVLLWTITTQRPVNDSMPYLRDTIRTEPIYNFNTQ